MCFKRRKETENRLAVLEEKVRLLDAWREQKNIEVKHLEEELQEAKRVSEFLWEVRGEKEPVAVWAGAGNGVLSVGVKVYDPVTMRVRSKTALFDLEGKLMDWSAVRMSEKEVKVVVYILGGEPGEETVTIRREFIVDLESLSAEEITIEKTEQTMERMAETVSGGAATSKTKKPRKPRTKKSEGKTEG